MRAQDCDASGASGAAFPAKPLGIVSLRRLWRELERHREWRAFGFWFCHECAPEKSRVRVYRAGGVGRVSVRLRRQAPRVPDTQCGRVLGAADARIAAKARLRNCFAGCNGNGFIRSPWNLFWDAERAAFWFAR